MRRTLLTATGRGFVVFVLMAALPLGGCFRTRYVNLTPQIPKTAGKAPFVDRQNPSWRSFFIYGWAPSEMRIDAGATCGGPEHIERIETQRSFLQGLVAAFAGYYINIYSPYTGGVVCDDELQ